MMTKGPSRISPFTIPKLMVNAASGQVSIRWGLRGPNSAIATACASAANAIGDAFKIIQYGQADVMVTGGSEAAITHMGLGGFASMRALSTRNDDPTRASRPFDRDRDGFVLAEGAGILDPRGRGGRPQARGARIYAEVLGYGMSADGSHITAPDEEGRGAARAMQLCLEDAELAPETVDYINAHGTSTGLGDLAETKAMKTGLRPARPQAPDLQHQEPARPPPGRLRRRRADHLRPGDRARRPPADDQPRQPRRGLRPRLHPPRRPRGPRRPRHVQQLRLRRPQRQPADRAVRSSPIRTACLPAIGRAIFQRTRCPAIAVVSGICVRISRPSNGSRILKSEYRPARSSRVGRAGLHNAHR